MSVWLEMRCEGRREEGSYEPYRCYSHDNDGPAGDAKDTQADVIRTLEKLRAEGISSGWVRGVKGWFCPMCVKRKGSIL